NGTQVDSRRLAKGEPTVRLLAGTSLHEIPRDPEREELFESQLAGVPGTVPDDQTAWLTFMMEGVPRLQAAGWEVATDEGFPYRIVAAYQWYGDLGADLRRSEWFNLRLGVLVDGKQVNLLPALTRYLRSSLSSPGERRPGTDASGCSVGEFWLMRLD